MSQISIWVFSTPSPTIFLWKWATSGTLAKTCLDSGDINELPAGGTTRPFAQYPYLRYINWGSNDAHSNYNSLQATLTQRVSHGLTLIGGYTYAHGLDNGSLNRFGLLPENSGRSGGGVRQ